MTSKRRETEGNQTNEPEECGEFMTVDTLMPEDETGFLVLVCSLSVLTSFLFEVKGHWACVCVCVYVWLSALHHRHKELFDQSIISSQNNLVLPMFLWTVLHINHMPLKKKTHLDHKEGSVLCDHHHHVVLKEETKGLCQDLVRFVCHDLSFIEGGYKCLFTRNYWWLISVINRFVWYFTSEDLFCLPLCLRDMKLTE